MNTDTKDFLIKLLSGIGIALVLWLTKGLGLDSEIIFTQQYIKWIIIGIVRIILSYIRNTKDKNTKILKNILISIEIYLLLVIFIKNQSNFSDGEFLIFYLCGIGIVYESFQKRINKWKKYFFVIIYSLLGSLLLSIAIFMPYREAINEENFIQKQNYHLYVIGGEKNNQYSNVILEEKGKEKIEFKSGIQHKILNKKSDFSLSFISENFISKNQILIQDPKGNITEVYPQSKINFSTKDNAITIKNHLGKYKLYKNNEQKSDFIQNLKKEYTNSKKDYILKTLPTWIQKNPKYQKISIEFTKKLGKSLPIRYANNTKISEMYLPYLDIKEYGTKGKEDINNKNNYQIKIQGTDKINNVKKYKEFLKRSFF